MSSSTVRIRTEDLTKLKEISSSLGISLEKCISKILKLIDQDSATEELLIREEPHEEERLASDLQKIKRLLCRVIVTVCPLAEEDANDPDFGIGLADVYEDRNKHPEKYRQ